MPCFRDSKMSTHRYACSQLTLADAAFADLEGAILLPGPPLLPPPDGALRFAELRFAAFDADFAPEERAGGFLRAAAADDDDRTAPETTGPEELAAAKAARAAAEDEAPVALVGFIVANNNAVEPSA